MTSQGNLKHLVLLAFIASLNCALEASLGSYLHLIHSPFTGMVMGGINIIIYLIACRVRPKPGTISLIAIITALGNLYLAGGFKLFAVLAIVLEGILADIVVSWSGFSKKGFILASITISMFSLLYPLVTFWFMLGYNPVQVWNEKIINFYTALHLPPALIYLILAAILALHLCAAVVWVELGWKIMHRMQDRRDDAHPPSVA